MRHIGAARLAIAALSLGLSGCVIFGPSRPGSVGRYTIVFAAASHGDVAVVRAAIEQDPSLVRRTEWGGNSLLHDAAEKRQSNMATLLLDHGADPDLRNAIGFTPLHIAAQNDDRAMIALLIARHAQVSIRDARDRTPFDVALAWHHPAAAQMIYDAGGRTGGKGAM